MSNDVCWIEVIGDDHADMQLKSAYDAVRRPDGSIHNLYQAFSAFPAPLVAADTFYREIMHSPDAPLPMWLAELLSVDVAILNGCEYAATHHGANFVRLLSDNEEADKMLAALRSGDVDASIFGGKLTALLQFCRKLTTDPATMNAEDIAALRGHGWSDAEISQAVQVTASFAYWTRFINALGIRIGDERVGKYD